MSVHVCGTWCLSCVNTAVQRTTLHNSSAASPQIYCCTGSAVKLVWRVGALGRTEPRQPAINRPFKYDSLCYSRGTSTWKRRERRARCLLLLLLLLVLLLPLISRLSLRSVSLTVQLIVRQVKASVDKKKKKKKKSRHWVLRNLSGLVRAESGARQTRSCKHPVKSILHSSQWRRASLRERERTKEKPQPSNKYMSCFVWKKKNIYTVFYIKAHTKILQLKDKLWQ